MKQRKTDTIAKTFQSKAFESQTPLLTVLIPTYNRWQSLAQTLRALERQTADDNAFEVVVVDDGSTDATRGQQKDFAGRTGLSFLYLCLQENGGPARARNAGLARCRGKVVLIIGDDIEPAQTLVARHLEFHRQNSGTEWALLGHVCFPDELRQNPFMHWLETDGRKYFFNYAELEDGREADPLFFYTCNVSVKMALLDKSGWFDESFPYASHEDLELGYRLADKGMRLVYDSSATGYHWHELTISGIARRVYLMGHSAEIFWNKVGDTGSLTRRVARRIIVWVSSLPPMVLLWQHLRTKTYGRQKSHPLQWQVLLFLGFFIGLSDAKKKNNLRV